MHASEVSFIFLSQNICVSKSLFLKFNKREKVKFHSNFVKYGSTVLYNLEFRVSKKIQGTSVIPTFNRQFIAHINSF